MLLRQGYRVAIAAAVTLPGFAAQSTGAIAYLGMPAHLATTGSEAPSKGTTWDLVRNGKVVASNSAQEGWAAVFDAKTHSFALQSPSDEPNLGAPLGKGYTVRFFDGKKGYSAPFELDGMVPCGGAARFAISEGPGPDAGFQWEAIQAGVVVGSSQTPNGWSLSAAPAAPSFMISVPRDAKGVRTEIRCAAAAGGFSCWILPVAGTVAASYAPQPILATANLSDTDPADGQTSSAFAYSIGAGGELSHDPPADLTEHVGNQMAAMYKRTYVSALALQGRSSPGLPAGWFENYSWTFVPDNAASWSALKLVHPNGAVEVFTPQLQDGKPTGAFAAPTDAAYTLTGAPGTTTGAWSSLTLTQDSNVWTFEPNGDAPIYPLTTLTNSPDHYLRVVRDPLGRLRAVKTELDISILQCKYNKAGFVDVVWNNHGQDVAFKYGPGASGPCLTSASQIVFGDEAAVAEWVYSYQPVLGRLLLSGISKADDDIPGKFSGAKLSYEALTGRASQ